MASASLTTPKEPRPIVFKKQYWLTPVPFVCAVVVYVTLDEAKLPSLLLREGESGSLAGTMMKKGAGGRVLAARAVVDYRRRYSYEILCPARSPAKTRVLQKR